MDLREVVVEPVAAADESRYQRLMQAHHYLGALPKIGETQWYVARWRREWVALIGFSAPCRAQKLHPHYQPGWSRAPEPAGVGSARCPMQSGRSGSHRLLPAPPHGFGALVGCEFLFKRPSAAEMIRGSMTSSGSHPGDLPAGLHCQLLD